LADLLDCGPRSGTRYERHALPCVAHRTGALELFHAVLVAAIYDQRCATRPCEPAVIGFIFLRGHSVRLTEPPRWLTHEGRLALEGRQRRFVARMPEELEARSHDAQARRAHTLCTDFRHPLFTQMTASLERDPAGQIKGRVTAGVQRKLNAQMASALGATRIALICARRKDYSPSFML